jgi:hypothetical protein
MSKMAEYQRERYRRLKENHMCVRCKKQDSLTLQGLTMCEECAKMSAIRSKQYKEKHSEAIKEMASLYYANHKYDPEYKAKQAANHKSWYEKNRDEWNAYRREYRRNRKAKGGDDK